MIQFNETAQYLEPCFNGTLVQANPKNKKRIREALLQGVTAHGIAFFDKALVEAFELFLSVSLCHFYHCFTLITPWSAWTNPNPNPELDLCELNTLGYLNLTSVDWIPWATWTWPLWTERLNVPDLDLSGLNTSMYLILTSVDWIP